MRIRLKARKPYMCGTDSAKAMGLSRFKTPIDLYEDKTNHEITPEEITLKQHYRLQSGHAMEPVIQEAIALQIGAEACRDKRMFVRNKYPYMACNIDGFFM